MPLLRSLGQDLACALRRVRRSPGLSGTIVLTLGGAIAVNASLFSVFNQTLLRPWPVPDPARVVRVDPPVSLSEWRHWRESSEAFADLLARGGEGTVTCRGRKLRFELVSADYFDVLGVPIGHGRGFVEAHARDGGAAVLSHTAWMRLFDGESTAGTLSLDGIPFVLAGVAAPSFEGVGLQRTDLWLPLAAGRRLDPSNGTEPLVEVAGRLAPGVSADHARAMLATLSDGFRGESDVAASPIAVRSTDPYSRLIADPLRAWMVHVLLLAPTFLTLVACANVANLLLIGGNARRGEIAVRLALGSSRVRLVRQQLTETMILALLAGLSGLAVARALPGYVLGSHPGWERVRSASSSIDGAVVAWTFGLSLLACLAFGLAPALQCTVMSVERALKDAHGLSPPALKSRLLGYQVMVSVVALVVTGLLMRSVYRHAPDVHAPVDQLAVGRLELPRRYGAEERLRFAHRYYEELRTLVGGESVTTARPAGERLLGPKDARGGSRRLWVSDNFFSVLGIPLLSGRVFGPADAEARVVIVNEALARRCWPGESPIGQVMGERRTTGTGVISWRFGPDVDGREVIGVVKDAAATSADVAGMSVFLPARPGADDVFVVRGPRGRDTRRLAVLANELDPAVRAEVLSGSAWQARSTRSLRLFMRIVGVFGAVAVALAALGVFTVTAYDVQRRRRELGIRIALGARRAHVLAAALGSASQALLRGLVLGASTALGVGVLVRHLTGLPGVSLLDPITYAGAVGAVAATAGAAAALPMRRATRVEPSEVLRYE